MFNREKGVVGTNDGGEPVVMDDMILGRNEASTEIPDQTDSSGVGPGEAEKLTLTGTGFPFGNFTSILKTGIEDIRRTSPHAGTAKLTTIQ